MNVKTSLGMIATITVMGLAGMSQAYQANNSSAIQDHVSLQQPDRVFSVGKSPTQGAGLNKQQHLPLVAKRKKKRIVVGSQTVFSDTVKAPPSDSDFWLS